jgi:hypothetical protein
MALEIHDRVKETTTTTGTGTYTLAGAVTGFETFTANLDNSDTTYYCCTDNTDFEIGIGTFTSSGTTLARTTILASSNSNSAVNWSSGTRTIFMTYPADKAVFEDASGHVSIPHDLFIAGGLIDLKNDGGAVSQIKFYCESSNAHAQTLIGAPHSESASNTLTLPSSGGSSKLLSATSTATVTNKSIDSDNNTITNIVNADIKSSAAIADTKLDTISTAGKVAISALDIDGGTDIGAALADADEIIVDDGGGGTNRRSDMSRVKTYIADVTLTTAAQTNITSLGTLTGLTVSGDVTLTGDNYNIVFDKSDDALEFADNAKATFGTGNDLEIFHDSSHSYIKDVGTGQLRITGGLVQLRNSSNNESMLKAFENGAVELYHDNSKKLETTSTGVTVTGEVDATSLDISGDADIDGTLEADAITVNGTALNTVIADEATALAIALG